MSNRRSCLSYWFQRLVVAGVPVPRTHDVWVVRERLKVDVITALEKYHGMPLVREARAFIKDGAVKCIHAYWPIRSIYEGVACEHQKPQKESVLDPDPPCQECGNFARQCYKAADISNDLEVGKLTEDVAKAFSDDGAWSVDVLRANEGYYVTDMATAYNSYHEDGCRMKEELAKL